MILKKDQKEDIARRIDFIQVQLKDLEKFKALDWETYKTDRDTQRNIERLAENIANAAIDISKVALTGEEVEMPNSYREVILKLGDIGLIQKDLALKISQFAALRNILAHQYLDLRWDKIKQFIEEAPEIISRFTDAVTARL